MEKYLDNIFTEVDSNIKLDENQKQVILDKSKNCIVIAGAGSGKTTTITAKVKYLVEKERVNPKQILIISFTNKAIEELRERINNSFNIPVDICTFHKFAYDILKQHNSNYRILSNNEDIIKEIIKNNCQTKDMIKLLLKDKIYKKNSKKVDTALKYFIRYTINNINLYKISNNVPKNKIAFKYKEYIDQIINTYEKYISEKNFLDFEDIIIKASKIITKINYKYIIIDEYQDISLNRFNLVDKIIENNEDVRTIVVGDDWQAIFSFAGSNINLFLDFKQRYNASMYKIVNTYRNSQELIDIAGTFIMKNNKQLTKSLISNKRLTNPIEIFFYKTDINYLLTFILDRIVKEYGLNKSILILGRYKKDINLIHNYNINIKNDRIIYKNNSTLIINFCTIHAAKGLGYDNVIIINLENDIYGFPSQIKEDSIRKELFDINDTMNEERRLFYVAITRTKNKVFLLCKKNKESIFIKEIKKYNNILINKKVY